MPAPPSPDLWMPDLDALAAAVAQADRPAPAAWDPPRCGDSGIRIGRDGRWWHEGAPIARPAMVRLFASVLRREPDGGFALVTPAEKLSVTVEDAPFLAMELRAEAGRLVFRLSTGDLVIAGPAHPLRLEQHDCEARPYLTVRHGLDALIARPVFYELAELALAQQPTGVWSDGSFFPLGGAA